MYPIVPRVLEDRDSVESSLVWERAPLDELDVTGLEAPTDLAERAAPPRRTLSLSETIHESTRRPGLDLDLLSLARIGVLAGLAPSLEITFDYGKGAARSASVTAAGTVDLHDRDWALVARLCWGSCSSTAVILDHDGSTDQLEPGLAETLYVFDGEVYDDGTAIAAAANVAQRVLSYEHHLGGHIADAWLSRSRLVAEASAIETVPLREQVMHALQIQELEARLDALTDGEFGRSLRRSEDF